ncbi:hypothetical protein ABPG75_002955 [Micractinium tetrahymenae]
MAGAASIIALLLLALACCALTSREHLIGETRTISGRTILIAHDFEDRSPSVEYLLVRTASGERIHVLRDERHEYEGVHTGMHANVTGVWLSRKPGTQHASSAAAAKRIVGGAAGAQHRAAHGMAAHGPTTRRGTVIHRQLGEGGAVHAAQSFYKPDAFSSFCFYGARVELSGAFRSPPLVKKVVAPVAAASALGVAQVAATVSSNQLVASEIKTLFVPIAGVDASGAACPNTALPKYSAADIKKAVFEELNPGGTTVGSTFNRCSFGKSRLTMTNSLVADLVKLPCAGYVNGYAYTFSKCDFDDFNGWSDAADKVLRTRGIDIDAYTYKVYLVPPSACSFVGLGYVGCDGSLECRSWINSDFWTTPQAITHELGHNMFMAHAGKYASDGWYDEYADMSSYMGYCCNDRCPNTPQAWQLGWLTVQQHDASSLAPGQTVQAWLASQAASPSSGLRIDVSGWAPGVDPLHVGYRTRAGGDAALGADLADRVHVWQTPIKGAFDPQKTALKGSLTAGGAYAHKESGIVIQLTGFASGGATVSICRKSSDPASCQIKASAKAPPPAKPRPPPPRPPRATPPPLLRRPPPPRPASMPRPPPPPPRLRPRPPPPLPRLRPRPPPPPPRLRPRPPVNKTG